MNVNELKRVVDQLVLDGYGEDIVSLYPADGAYQELDFTRPGGDWTVVDTNAPGGEDNFVTFLFDWQPS